MVMYSVLVPIAVLGVLAFLAFAFFQRGREGFDVSPRGLLRLYLYIASLAGMLVLAVGLASATNAALAYGFGAELIYGGSFGPVPAQVRPCPPNEKCPPGATPEEQERFLREQSAREREDRERRRAEDLIRGGTFAVFGGLFWGAHWGARRRLVGAEERLSALRRGYLMVGTAIFGLTTIIALPTGVQQALSAALLPQSSQFGAYRQGADSLGAGIVALVIWLVYLRLVVRELRAG